MALDVAGLAKKLRVSEAKFLEALKGIPFEVGGKLGCGNIGCTFAGARGYVVKVTGDETEIELWRQIMELEQKGHDLSQGVPKIFGLGYLKSIKAYWVCREEVEPLVLGSKMELSGLTKQYLFGREVPTKLTLTEDDWSFESLLDRYQLRVPSATRTRAKHLDEDLHKLYFLTDIVEAAERQPSIAKDTWMRTYIESAMSVRGPLSGVGDVLATILAETGERWTTDVHLGNVGWRLHGKPTLLVYDWLTADFVPNGAW